jgi:Coenzyme PQQ synthesis protein D (PqqD)
MITFMTGNIEMQSSTLVPVKDIVFTDFEGGEGILVDLNTKQYYRLNETGALIWRGLEKGNTIGDIVSEMQARYDVSGEHALASVEKLLASLESNKLVQRV